MANGNFKDYQEEQILIEYDVIKHLILLNESPKYNGYKKGLFLIVCKFLMKSLLFVQINILIQLLHFLI